MTLKIVTDEVAKELKSGKSNKETLVEKFNELSTED